jgi:hypothetical protein
MQSMGSGVSSHTHSETDIDLDSQSNTRKRSSSGVLSPVPQEERKLPLKKLFENLQVKSAPCQDKLDEYLVACALCFG